MPRKERPVKIKRYNRGAPVSAGRKETVRKMAVLFALVAALVLAVYFLGRPLMKLLTREKPADVPTGPRVSDAAEPDISDVSEGEEYSRESSETVVPARNRIYYYAEPSQLSDHASIDSTVARRKAAGANCLVFDAKTKEGLITWDTGNEYGSKLLYETQIDLPYLVNRLKEESMAPVARLYAFMDRNISTVVRSTAVMYRGTDSRWLDSSVDLGGKAWANPASPVMQDYLVGLTGELMDLGVRDFIFAAFHTPTGYSLEYRDFGTSMDGVLANMKSLLKTLAGKVSSGGGDLLLQVEYDAVKEDGDYARYIVHPFQLGCSGYIVTMNASAADVNLAVSRLKDTVDRDPEIESVTLWVTPPADRRITGRLGSRFIN